MAIGVFNPVGEIAASESASAATLQDLAGRSVGFVFNHHPAVMELWSQLEQHIERELRPASVQRIAKANISMPQPQSQLAELASTVEYALVGVGA